MIAIDLHLRAVEYKRTSAIEAIAVPAGQSIHAQPRLIVPLRPSPGHTYEDVLASVAALLLTALPLTVDDGFFDADRWAASEDQVRAAVRDAVRARWRERGLIDRDSRAGGDHHGAGPDCTGG